MDPTWQRRNRRSRGPSLGTVAATAVIAYGTYRLASWAWSTWYGEDNPRHEEEQILFESNHTGNFNNYPSREMKPHQWRNRRQRMVRCREEAMKAIHGFLPTLRRVIEEKTSTSMQTESLKQLRSQRDEPTTRQAEKELWEIIKVKAVTRMVATAYAHSILFLVVTVQVNLLGGKLFEEQLRDSSSDDGMGSVASDRMEAYSSSHKLVLQHTYQYFFDQGLDSLVASVERAAQKGLENWNVLDASSLNISKEAFDQAIHNIRAEEEQARASSRTKRPRSFMRFLMPRTESLEETVTDELARWILDETWDLLESPILMDAQRDCLDCTFSKMRDEYWGKIFDVDEQNSSDLPRHAANRTVTRPLAHVVTRLKHTSKSFYKSSQQLQPSDGFMPVTAVPGFTANSYCAAVEHLPSVLELADVSFN